MTIAHGSLVVKVPSDIFSGADGSIDAAKAEPFRDMLRNRYPWLNDNSLDTLMRKAGQEYVRIMDAETKGRVVSKDLESRGLNEAALAHLERHLEQDPEDADSWYALGDLLCKMGRAEEGYKAYARGRQLF